MGTELSNLGVVDPATPDGTKIINGTSLLAGLGALASASCCALPLALSMAGVSSAWLIHLGVLVQNRELIAIAALAVLTIGWFFALRSRVATCGARSDCTRPAARLLTFGMLSLSTVFVGLAFAYSWWEPAAIRFLWDWRTGA